jgi:polyphosphate kinase
MAALRAGVVRTPTARSRNRRAPADAPSPYLNRELSWLDYDARVLHEARDERNPPLERVKFLTIFANMLDEFFQVRVACLRQQVAAGSTKVAPDGRTPAEQLAEIRTRVQGSSASTRRSSRRSGRSWPKKASRSSITAQCRTTTSACASASWTRSSRS